MFLSLSVILLTVEFEADVAFFADLTRIFMSSLKKKKMFYETGSTVCVFFNHLRVIFWPLWMALMLSLRAETPSVNNWRLSRCVLTRSLWLLTVDDSAVQTGKTQPFTHSSYLVVKALIRHSNWLDLNPFTTVVHIKISKYIFKQDIINNDVYVHSRSPSVSSASVHKAADFSLSPSALSARPSSFTFCFFLFLFFRK